MHECLYNAIGVRFGNDRWCDPKWMVFGYSKKCKNDSHQSQIQTQILKSKTECKIYSVKLHAFQSLKPNSFARKYAL